MTADAARANYHYERLSDSRLPVLSKKQRVATQLLSQELGVLSPSCSCRSPAHTRRLG
jgi:hypothetical protein